MTPRIPEGGRGVHIPSLPVLTPSNAVRGSTFREKFGYPPTPTLAMELLVFLFLVGLFLL